MDRLEKIDTEIKNNRELTEKCRERLKPIKDQFKLLELKPITEEVKAEKQALAEQLHKVDKEYNKLRADFYFLSAQRNEAAQDV